MEQRRLTGSTGYLVVLIGAAAATNWGGGFFLFAGVATLAWIAIAGIRGSGGWTRSALAAVTIAWSLTWLGILLGASLFAVPRAVGYWVLLLSLGVVVIGTILVWLSARADVAKEDTPAN